MSLVAGEEFSLQNVGTVTKHSGISKKSDRKSSLLAEIKKEPGKEFDRDRGRLPVPISPVIHSALRAIYAGARRGGYRIRTDTLSIDTKRGRGR